MQVGVPTTVAAEAMILCGVFSVSATWSQTLVKAVNSKHNAFDRFRVELFDTFVIARFAIESIKIKSHKVVGRSAGAR